MPEDLLREATALVERAELKLNGQDEPVVVGFRRDGSASFYFGSEQAFQFNTARELRRAFAADLLYKADRGQLVSLRRQRSETETALVRTELTATQSASLLTTIHNRLTELHRALESNNYTLIGQVPEGTPILTRILSWLSDLPTQIPIAQRPHTR